VDFELGQLVKSLAGRDKDKHYLVVGFAEDRVLLSDGRCRPLNRVKKKNSKHLQPYNCVVPGIKERIRQGNLTDTILRNTLNSLLSAENSGKECPHYLRTSLLHGG
jgi:ribosomal protein L14E/L6E/L27E